MGRRVDGGVDAAAIMIFPGCIPAGCCLADPGTEDEDVVDGTITTWGWIVEIGVLEYDPVPWIQLSFLMSSPESTT